MAAIESAVRFEKIAEKWHALAQRRLAYIRELERSGRWKRYYSEEEYALCLHDAARAVMLWGRLAAQPLARDPNAKDARPAA